MKETSQKFHSQEKPIKMSTTESSSSSSESKKSSNNISTVAVPNNGDNCVVVTNSRKEESNSNGRIHPSSTSPTTTKMMKKSSSKVNQLSYRDRMKRKLSDVSSSTSTTNTINDPLYHAFKRMCQQDDSRCMLFRILAQDSSSTPDACSSTTAANTLIKEFVQRLRCNVGKSENQHEQSLSTNEVNDSMIVNAVASTSTLPLSQQSPSTSHRDNNNNVHVQTIKQEPNDHNHHDHDHLHHHHHHHVHNSTVCNENNQPSSSSSSSNQVKKSNVRIQCKIVQYLATQIRKLPLALSLSLMTPRLPMPAAELQNLRYGKYFRVEQCPNGYAKVLHLYWDEIAHLDRQQKLELSAEFMKESFREVKPNVSAYVISIVHNAAYYMPDWLEWLSDSNPNLAVKAGKLGQSGSDIETTTMTKYRQQVSETLFPIS